MQLSYAAQSHNHMFRLTIMHVPDALTSNTKYSIVNIILNVPHDVDERLQLCYLCRTETDPQPQTSLVNQVFPLSHLKFFLNFFSIFN